MIGILPSGSSVICIDAEAHDVCCPLREGEIYKVRGYTRSSRPGCVAVLLEEIQAPQQEGVSEPGFDCCRFRPLMLPPDLLPDEDSA